MTVGGATRIAGVVGRPVSHSLSPLLHNAWLEAAMIDGVYVALAPPLDGFARLIEGFRGGVLAGVNVTVPFKTEALDMADSADAAARQAGAANLLLFHADGLIEACNTDGLGLLAAFQEQAPLFHVEQGPVVILGAGGAARGAAAALKAAGCPAIRIVNRTLTKAEAIADVFGAKAYDLQDAGAAFLDASAIINATSAGLGHKVVDWPLTTAPETALVMDMTYRPLETPFLARAKARSMTTVDGLAMLIGQAAPSFQALFGAPRPVSIDARSLLLAALEANP